MKKQESDRRAGEGARPGRVPDAAWSDIVFTQTPEPLVSYRTGWVVYEESLSKGLFAGRGWNGAGFINFYDGRISVLEHPMPQAFWLEIDGQFLASDWEWVLGSSISIGSINSFVISNIAPGYNGNYCVAKAGVMQVARGMAAKRAKKGTRVNALAPGHVLTDTTAAGARIPKAYGRNAATIPLGRSSPCLE